MRVGLPPLAVKPTLRRNLPMLGAARLCVGPFRLRSLGLDRFTPLPGLPGPPGELSAVVLEDEPGGHTSSRKTISVESDRRGPSFRIRV